MPACWYVACSPQLDGAHMLAGQPLAATMGFGTKAQVVTAFSTDLNGNGITVSKALWDEMKAKSPALRNLKPAHPVKADMLKPVVQRMKAAGTPMRLGRVFPVSTVALCSLWPTLVNTALGVASIDKDHMNVARVLKLGWLKKVTTIVIPSALPLIFTGLRLSLGVGWMVLIAAEMLAQNPGLGKFVWDMFQNGSSQTLAQIVVAVFTIGGIGFVLDRTMMLLQRSVSLDSATVL
jgi:nitrate/nitrite transport system permease protein